MFLIAPAMAATHAEEPIEIAGEVDGLYPGASATLQAEVANPHPFPIEVTSFDVAVSDASALCPASALEIGSAGTGVVIDPGETGLVPIEVEMARSAPESCQGATWPLSYVATVVEVASGGVVPPEDPGEPIDDLPFTGADVLGLLAIGSTLVVIGVLAVRLARGRTGGSGV